MDWKIYNLNFQIETFTAEQNWDGVKIETNERCAWSYQGFREWQRSLKLTSQKRLIIEHSKEIGYDVTNQE